jgi:hypothetical protein
MTQTNGRSRIEAPSKLQLKMGLQRRKRSAAIGRPSTSRPEARPSSARAAPAPEPITADIVLLDRGKHFACGRDGAPWRVGIVERRAEQRQEAVPEKLVHDAAIAIDDLDQYRKRCVQSVDNLLRSAGARRGRKAADVDEHDGDLPRIAPS